MYELLALDIDGTLIGYDDPNITKRNVESVHEAKENGVKIVLLTGRNYGSMKGYNKQLDLDGYLMTINGAVVVDSATESILSEVSIGKEIADQIVFDLEEREIPYILFCGMNLYAREENRELDTVRMLDMDSGNVTLIKEYAEIQQVVTVHKIVAIWPTEELKKLIPTIKEYSADTLHFEFGFVDHMDIYPSIATKGDALRNLAQSLNVDLEKVMAIGDAQTDVSMIKMAGMGIAMGNAPDDVKEVADYVTKGVEEDGVAYAVDKFILNNE